MSFRDICRISFSAFIFVELALLGIAGFGVRRASAVPRQKPAATAADNYKAMCATCHMLDGKHFVSEMSFADGVWKHGSSVKEIQKVIAKGIEGTAMKPFEERLSEKEILDLAKYVRSFDKKLEPEKEPKK